MPKDPGAMPPATDARRGAATMDGRELERWLGLHTAALRAGRVTASLGRGPTLRRGPTLGAGRGSTWISFQSQHALARAVLLPGGRCEVSASSTVDGSPRFAGAEQVSTSAGLDDVLARLVVHLT